MSISHHRLRLSERSGPSYQLRAPGAAHTSIFCIISPTNDADLINFTIPISNMRVLYDATIIMMEC
jgi:hypothetical protein